MSASDWKRRNRISGKDIRDKFFKHSDKQQGVWECIFGTLREQSRLSYGNLEFNIKQQHPGDFKIYLKAKNLAKSLVYQSWLHYLPSPTGKL